MQQQTEFEKETKSELKWIGYFLLFFSTGVMINSWMDAMVFKKINQKIEKLEQDVARTDSISSAPRTGSLPAEVSTQAGALDRSEIK